MSTRGGYPFAQANARAQNGNSNVARFNNSNVAAPAPAVPWWNTVCQHPAITETRRAICQYWWIVLIAMFVLVVLIAIGIGFAAA